MMLLVAQAPKKLDISLLEQPEHAETKRAEPLRRLRTRTGGVCLCRVALLAVGMVLLAGSPRYWILPWQQRRLREDRQPPRRAATRGGVLLCRVASGPSKGEGVGGRVRGASGAVV